MMTFIVNTSSGVLVLPGDTDKLDHILRIIDALSVDVFDIHPRVTATQY